MHSIHETSDLHTYAIGSTHMCVRKCVECPYSMDAAHIRSHLCSPSENAATERKSSVMSIKLTHACVLSCIKLAEFARKIHVPREYMRFAHNLCARLIKACIVFQHSVYSVSSVVKNYSRAFAFIRG